MKKFFSYIFIALIVIGFFVPTNKTEAVTASFFCESYGGVGGTPSGAACAEAASYCVNKGLVVDTVPNSAFRNCVNSYDPAANPPAPEPTNPNYIACKNGLGSMTEANCRLTYPDTPAYLKCVQDGGAPNTCLTQNPTTPTGTVASTPGGIFWFVAGRVGFALLWLMSWLLGVGGWLLNYSLKWTVLDWSANISKMTGINIAWKLFRDLMNIVFIFMLVYQSIKLVIGLESRQNIQKFIGSIILVSLLINFSLFFTKVIIDASNVVTIGMYQNILGDQKDPNVGLSDAYMQSLGMASFYSSSSVDDFANANNNDGGKMLLIGLVGSALFLVVSFVFFSISIMFLIRYLILIALLFSAAVGMMGLTHIGMSKWAKEWWNTLWGQVLFGPVFMIMTWVSLTIIASPGFITANGSAKWSDMILKPSPTTAAGTQSSIELLINFALVIGLAVMTLVVSKQFSTQGSKQMSKWGDKATAFAGGAVLGGAAGLSRNTVGRAGNRIANSEWLKSKAPDSALARMALKTGDKAAKGTFDARNSFVGKGIQSGLGTGSGINLGKGPDAKKTNFAAVLKARADKAKEKATLLKPSESAVVNAKETLQSDEFKDREERKHNEHLAYIKSDEYLESDTYKKKLEAEKEQRELKIKDSRIATESRSIEDNINSLTLAAGNATDNNRKIQINNEINKLKSELITKQAERKEFKSAIDERQKLIDQTNLNETNWMSEEYKSLVSTAGGTKKLNDDKNLNIEKITQPIEEAFKARTEALAAKEENVSLAWRLLANAVGTPLSVVTGGAIAAPKTKADRQAIARAIKSASKSKTADQEAAELLKKMRKEAKARGEKFDDDDDDKTPPAAPTPTPPAGGTTT